MVYFSLILIMILFLIIIFFYDNEFYYYNDDNYHIDNYIDNTYGYIVYYNYNMFYYETII